MPQASFLFPDGLVILLETAKKLSCFVYLPGTDLKSSNKFKHLGRGGGLVVSVLTFYSDDASLNPAGNKNTKMNYKGLAHLKKTSSNIFFSFLVCRLKSSTIILSNAGRTFSVKNFMLKSIKAL